MLGIFFVFVVFVFNVGVVMGLFVMDEVGVFCLLFWCYGFWFIVIVMFVVMLMLGIYLLMDFWEIYYGEVLCEMLLCDDWISIWWC